MRKFITALGAVVVLGSFGFLGTAEAAPAAPQGYQAYKVKAGDSLSRLGGKNWRQVCQVNQKAKVVTDCNKIRKGQTVFVPKKTNPALKAATVAPSAITGQVRSSVAPKRPAKSVYRSSVVVPQGYTPWIHVGGAPLINCGKDKAVIEAQALQALSFTAEEQAEFRAKKAKGESEEIHLKPGTRFAAVTFCKNGHAAVTQKMVAAWNPKLDVVAQAYTLSSGRRAWIVKICGNLVLLEEEPAPPPAQPPPPAPPPEEPAPPPPAPPLAPPEEEPKPECFDWKAVVGLEVEPKQNGDSARGAYVAGGALFKCWRGETGTHKLGVGIQGSDSTGTVNDGLGRYNARLATIGPYYVYESDKGWDMGAKLLYGKLEEDFRQGDYRSERKFDIVGASVEHNDYRRLLAGKKWLPERQLFALCGVPISKRSAHWWQGQSISDTTSLEEFNFICSVGVRQYLYDHGKFLSYLQGGLFAEDPTSLSASLRLGITDPKKRAGIGIGPDFDLKDGGVVGAIGGWVDVRQIVKVERAKKRAEQAQMVYDRSIASTPQGMPAAPVTTTDPEP